MTRANRSISTYPFKPGFPHELELGSLRDTIVNTKGMATMPHRTDFHQIVWVQTGKATLLLDFKAIPMGPNSLLFIRKNRILMYDKSGNCDGKVLRFTDGFFVRNEDDARFLMDCRLFRIINGEPAISLAGEDTAMQMLVNLMERELATRNDSHQHAALQNLLHNFLILSERIAGSPPDEGRIEASVKADGQKFVDMVEAGFRKERKVSAYARRLGIPEKRLQAATSKAFGKAAKELIDERVALEAKRMLLFSGASVKEVSHELAFDEVTNFIKYFRKHAGTTPAAFRSRYKI